MSVPSVPFLDIGATYDELREPLDEAYRRVMASGWYILGEECTAFEAEWAAYCGAAHCVGVGNGLDALVLILRALDVGPGDEVIVPSSTYIASWLAVTEVGATPIPVEPDPRTANLDAGRIEAALTPRTRAVMPVHLYGQGADMEPILALARRVGLHVVEDAAQAHGARVRGRRVGAIGVAAGWSFYPGKNLGAFGDGGAVTTDDPALADRVRVIRNYGSRRKYVNEVAGVNSRLDELHAAMLRAKLPALDEWNARRVELARRYQDALAGLPGLTLPYVPEWAEPVWHLYVVRHPARDALQRHLAERGVGTLIHYPTPPHLSGAYAARGWARGDFPIAEAIADTCLSLPIGPHLSDAQQARVIDAVTEFATSPSVAALVEAP